MKTIGLMQVRNEGHILPYTLPPLAQVCDHVIIADQHSTDDTRAVIKKCTKAILVDNNEPPPPKGRFDSARQLLLDTARNFDGNNLLLCIDADEIAPPAVFCHLKEDIGDRYPIGMKFATPWVLIWKKASRYLVPEGWMQPSLLNWIWYDDRQHQYQDTCWIHSGRLPTPPTLGTTLPPRYSLLHFQWFFLEKTRWKQAWYQMMEFTNAQFDREQVYRINQFYQRSNTLADDPFALTRRLPKKWRTGYEPPQNNDDPKLNWHKDEIWQMIDTYGIEVFEPLDIWYVAELKNHFEQTLKRLPQSQMLPRKNMLRSQLSYPIKIPERAIRRTTWYKKLKGKPL